MQIFLYEHITGGGLCAQPLPESLAVEGRAMHRAIASDLSRLADVSVVTTRDARFPSQASRGVRDHAASNRREARAVFDALARESDGTLLIAPELDGTLLRLARRVEAAGGRLLGPAPDAIEAAADKLLLPGRLRERGVRGLEAAPFPLRGRQGDRFPRPLVVKPRQGAGSVGVQVSWTGADAVHLPRSRGRQWIATPLLTGLDASVLVLAGPGKRLALAPCRQLLSSDGRMRYLGGEVPLPEPLAERSSALALAAVECIPGLAGFVGVDLILAPGRPGEARDCVVEINCRLTTSYVGLRELSRGNLARVWLEVVLGKRARRPVWKSGAIRFSPDGAVSRLRAAARSPARC